MLDPAAFSKYQIQIVYHVIQILENCEGLSPYPTPKCPLFTFLNSTGLGYRFLFILQTGQSRQI